MTSTITVEVPARPSEAVPRAPRTRSLGGVEPRTRRRRSRWPWGLGAALFMLYTIVGAWLIDAQGFTIGDANARTTSALIMVLSRDPHLAAMGFYWPPAPMFIRVPFVLAFEPLGWAIYAGPVSTALCVALTVPVLARIGKELALSTRTTVTFILLYALNPVTVYTAANAMSEAMFGLVLAIGLLGFIRLTKAPTSGNLALIGLTLGLGIATRIEFVPLTVAFVVAALLLIPKELRLRGAAVVLAPPVFVFLIWSWASSLIVGDALYWYHEGKASGASVTYRPWLPDPLTSAGIVGYVVTMILVVAPTLPICFAVLLRRRRGMRALLGLAAVVFVQPVFVAVQLQMGVSTGEPRYFSLLPLPACVMCMWAIARTRRGPELVRRTLMPALVAVSVVGAIFATYVHARPNVTQITSDGAFYAALVGRPEPPYPRNVDVLRPMMADLDPMLAKGAVVAADSRGGTMILFTRHPKQFLVPEDRKWEQTMADPTGRFDYAIIQRTLPSGPTVVLEAAMNAVEGGRFELVDKYGGYELYHFVSNTAGGGR